MLALFSLAIGAGPPYDRTLPIMRATALWSLALFPRSVIDRWQRGEGIHENTCFWLKIERPLDPEEQ